MPGRTVRISDRGYHLLCELVHDTGEPMQTVLDKALEQYRRQCFLKGLADDFSALRADPQAWAEELAERQEWDATLMDGLEPE